jgi:hypothetical protein
MATLLAEALASGARVARGFLGPVPPPSPPPEDPEGLAEAVLSREIEARIEATLDDVLEYHRTHRPANTTRNYAPKQKEWKVSCPQA